MASTREEVPTSIMNADRLDRTHYRLLLDNIGSVHESYCAETGATLEVQVSGRRNQRETCANLLSFIENFARKKAATGIPVTT